MIEQINGKSVIAGWNSHRQTFYFAVYPDRKASSRAEFHLPTETTVESIELLEVFIESQGWGAYLSPEMRNTMIEHRDRNINSPSEGS